MRAKVTKVFQGRPDGDALARSITPGEIIGGELAVVAVEQGWAETIDAASSAPPPSAGKTNHKRG